MTAAPKNFSDLVGLLIDLLSLAIPLIFALTLIFIIWKIIDAWVINAGDQTKVDEGKQVALVGVIALVVMSGVWGILELLRNSLFDI